jgi:hypothetical protein
MNCQYCNKECKNANSLRNHERLCKSNPNRDMVSYAGVTAMAQKVECKHCKKKISLSNIRKHEEACKKNPDNLRECPACGTKHTKKGVTCSYACYNVYFSKIRNPDENCNYRTVCFRYHEKKCIVCGEENILSVHHYDGDHHNDAPENLIPLCPTHHQYVHSQFKEMVQPIVDAYIERWKENLSMV